MSRQRIAQVQRLFSSAGLTLFQRLLGTTPNMAPPSNLKKPVSMVCSCIKLCCQPLAPLPCPGRIQPDDPKDKENDQGDDRILHASRLLDHETKGKHPDHDSQFF